MYKQRLLRHVKKFLNSIKLFLLFSTEISITEYRDVAYVQYRDVLIPVACVFLFIGRNTVRI